MTQIIDLAAARAARGLPSCAARLLLADRARAFAAAIRPAPSPAIRAGTRVRWIGADGLPHVDQATTIAGGLAMVTEAGRRRWISLREVEVIHG
ncbi:hypothetical protein [Tistrella mobilis]|uniref:Uncharacterized protein n=1 Tax=Tistrella mobilis (strain KA081020-065) TaxID=1110502 RepID=I3TGM1_TISMK|nr:hypothetical protein [Tistrella mobilis]AFK51909.1 hypothetical protein TMO_0070 [Tistrella mobilis KA081020-065]